jgi:hypothetical protein
MVVVSRGSGGGWVAGPGGGAKGRRRGLAGVGGAGGLTKVAFRGSGGGWVVGLGGGRGLWTSRKETRLPSASFFGAQKLTQVLLAPMQAHRS